MAQGTLGLDVVQVEAGLFQYPAQALGLGRICHACRVIQNASNYLIKVISTGCNTVFLGIGLAAQFPKTEGARSLDAHSHTAPGIAAGTVMTSCRDRADARFVWRERM